MKLVGVLLITALLIIPAATARPAEPHARADGGDLGADRRRVAVAGGLSARSLRSRRPAHRSSSRRCVLFLIAIACRVQRLAAPETGEPPDGP